MKKTKQQWEKIHNKEKNIILSYIKNKELNSYYQSNQQFFNSLINVLLLYPIVYSRHLQAKSNIQLMEWIISSTAKQLNDSKYALSERIYWILNNIQSWNDDRCKCKECRKVMNIKNNLHRFRGLFYGYSTYCSLKCIGKSEIVKQNRINRNIKKFGYANPYQSPKIIEKCKITKTKNHNDPNWNNRDKAMKTCIKQFWSSNSFIEQRSFIKSK